jgi:AAA+ ATPase superfamily predicted ATPase
MAIKIPFPAGVALGETFCNRHQERENLFENIISNQHCVLVSPRRYGKTSLIMQTLKENKIPHCLIDFFPATHISFVRNAILSGVGHLLTQLLPFHKKIAHSLLIFFKNLNPRIVLSAMGKQVELSPHNTPEKNIIEALMGLDETAKMLKTRVVMVFNEFPQIGNLKQGHEIETSVRHAVERSRWVTYIFSGSNRRLLTQMFNDKKRPLYHLCELIKLDRISREEFSKFTQTAAKKKWGRFFSEEVVKEILELTQCHTYYLNALCRRLWKLPAIPNVKQVEELWKKGINEQHSWISEDVGNLSVNQRLVLAALAYQPVQEPQGQAFCKLTGLTPASIKRALDTLLEKDFVFQNSQRFYQVLDPAILTYLRSIPYFNF